MPSVPVALRKTVTLPEAFWTTLSKTIEIAENEQVPICQDTGMACVFLEIGQDVHIADGDLTEAVNEGRPPRI